MRANLFSVLMTILWSSVLIASFSFLRTRTKLLHICGISTVILIYLFCAIRLVFPFEAPWTRVVSGGAIYKAIHGVFHFKVGAVRVSGILSAIWLIGVLLSLSVYFIRYRRAMRFFRLLPQEESRAGQEALDGLAMGSRIRVLRAAGLKSPCCIGIFRKRIFLPAKDYGVDELRYILLHEYTHLSNNDLLLKMLVRILCGIYWWNPLAYRLKRDLDQSMEIRCDLSVAGNLNATERADYLELILNTICENGLPKKYAGIAGLVEERSEVMVERFRIVADTKIVDKKRVNVFAGVLMLSVLALSYSFVLQSEYDTPLSEIETDEDVYQVDVEISYIVKEGDSYVLHTGDMETVIGENVAKWLQEKGFGIKTDG